MASNSRTPKQLACPPGSSVRFCFDDAEFWEGVEREAEDLDTRELAEFLSPSAPALDSDPELEAELLQRLKHQLRS